MKTIDIFHFDKEKSGNLLKKWLKDAGLSQHRAADLMGLHQDTLANCISGRVQDIKFEVVFKIALVTGHTVDDYIHDMLEGEDISFYSRAVPSPGAPDPAASAPIPAVLHEESAARGWELMASILDHQAAHFEKQLHLMERVHDREIERLEAILNLREKS